MKKIINGRIYDTSKAILIGKENNGLSHSDFNWWEAGLYKTPVSGKFFLAGSGGAMTRFSRTISQNEWCGGSKVIPMDQPTALQWAERYLEPEQIEQHFAVK